MIQTQAPTGARRLVVGAHDELRQVLASLDQIKGTRMSSRRAIPNPKIKPIVLRAEPTARVRRTEMHTYECYLGEQRVRSKCDSVHTTPDRAWVCLARYVVSQVEAKA